MQPLTPWEIANRGTWTLATRARAHRLEVRALAYWHHLRFHRVWCLCPLRGHR